MTHTLPRAPRTPCHGARNSPGASLPLAGGFYKRFVLCLCDLTGTFAAPWLEAGYSAVLIDPQHPVGVTVDGPVTRIGHTIDHPSTWAFLRLLQGRVAFTAAFPPCTDLAVSGARWFGAKGDANPAFQHRAMSVVHQCHTIAQMMGAPWFIENPVSQISTFWRKPDYSFHPHDFTGLCEGDNYTKKTMLWAGGGFVMPKPFRANLGEPDDRIHKAPPGEGRANFRSATPRGFARAVFHSNSRSAVLPRWNIEPGGATVDPGNQKEE